MTNIRVVLQSLDGCVVKSASEAPEAGDVIDMVGITLKGSQGIIQTGRGDLILHLDDELALDEISTPRLDKGGRLGTPGRSGKCQRQQREDGSGTHFGKSKEDEMIGFLCLRLLDLEWSRYYPPPSSERIATIYHFGSPRRLGFGIVSLDHHLPERVSPGSPIPTGSD